MRARALLARMRAMKGVRRTWVGRRFVQSRGSQKDLTGVFGVRASARSWKRSSLVDYEGANRSGLRYVDRFAMLIDFRRGGVKHLVIGVPLMPVSTD